MKHAAFVPFQASLGTKEDYEPFAVLHRETFDKDNPHPFNLTGPRVKGILSTYQPDVKWDDGKLYVVKNELGKLIAGAAVDSTFDELGSKRKYLWGVAVNPEYRGKGLGGNLLDKIIADNDANIPLDLKVLEANPHKDIATKLYTNKGFKLLDPKFTNTLLDKSNKHYRYAKTINN